MFGHHKVELVKKLCCENGVEKETLQTSRQRSYGKVIEMQLIIN